LKYVFCNHEGLKDHKEIKYIFLCVLRASVAKVFKRRAVEILDDFIPIKDPPSGGLVDQMETCLSGCEK
jgi:hypothetical protein